MKKNFGLVKTSRGKALDMNSLSRENSTEIAMTAGGLSMNARGDILGAGGKVVRTREEFERAYNIQNEKASKHVIQKNISIKKPLTPDIFQQKPANKLTPVVEEFSLEEVAEAIKDKTIKNKQKKAETE